MRMSKLELLNPHQAFVSLKNAFAILKLQYVLRAAPIRVGVDVCIPHFSRCGERICSRGLHGLSC